MEVLGAPDGGDEGGLNDSQLALQQILLLTNFGSSAKPRPSSDPSESVSSALRPEGAVTQILVVAEWDMVFFVKGGCVLVCSLPLSIDEDLEELFVDVGLVGARSDQHLDVDGSPKSLQNLLRQEILRGLDHSKQYCVGGRALSEVTSAFKTSADFQPWLLPEVRHAKKLAASPRNNALYAFGGEYSHMIYRFQVSPEPAAKAAGSQDASGRDSARAEQDNRRAPRRLRDAAEQLNRRVQRRRRDNATRSENKSSGAQAAGGNAFFAMLGLGGPDAVKDPERLAVSRVTMAQPPTVLDEDPSLGILDIAVIETRAETVAAAVGDHQSVEPTAGLGGSGGTALGSRDETGSGVGTVLLVATQIGWSKFDAATLEPLDNVLLSAEMEEEDSTNGQKGLCGLGIDGQKYIRGKTGPKSSKPTDGEGPSASSRKYRSRGSSSQSLGSSADTATVPVSASCVLLHGHAALWAAAGGGGGGAAGSAWPDGDPANVAEALAFASACEGIVRGARPLDGPDFLAAAILTSTVGITPTPAALLAQTGVLTGPRAAASARNASAAIEQTRKEERFGGEVGRTALGCLPANAALVFGSSIGLDTIDSKNQFGSLPMDRPLPMGTSRGSSMGDSSLLDLDLHGAGVGTPEDKLRIRAGRGSEAWSSARRDTIASIETPSVPLGTELRLVPEGLAKHARQIAEQLGLLPRLNRRGLRRIGEVLARHPISIPPQLPVMIGVRASSVYGDYASRGSGAVRLPLGSFVHLLRFRGDVLEPSRSAQAGPGAWSDLRGGGGLEALGMLIQQMREGPSGMDHTDLSCIPTSHWCSPRSYRMLGKALRTSWAQSSVQAPLSRRHRGSNSSLAAPEIDIVGRDAGTPQILLDADGFLCSFGAAIQTVTAGARDNEADAPQPGDSPEWGGLPDRATNELVAGVLHGPGEVLLSVGGSGRFVASDASIGSRNHLNAVQNFEMRHIAGAITDRRVNRLGLQGLGGSASDGDTAIGPILYGGKPWYLQESRAGALSKGAGGASAEDELVASLLKSVSGARDSTMRSGEYRDGAPGAPILPAGTAQMVGDTLGTSPIRPFHAHWHPSHRVAHGGNPLHAIAQRYLREGRSTSGLFNSSNSVVVPVTGLRSIPLAANFEFKTAAPAAMVPSANRPLLVSCVGGALEVRHSLSGEVLQQHQGEKPMHGIVSDPDEDAARRTMCGSAGVLSSGAQPWRLDMEPNEVLRDARRRDLKSAKPSLGQWLLKILPRSERKALVALALAAVRRAAVAANYLEHVEDDACDAIAADARASASSRAGAGNSKGGNGITASAEPSYSDSDEARSARAASSANRDQAQDGGAPLGQAESQGHEYIPRTPASSPLALAAKALVDQVGKHTLSMALAEFARDCWLHSPSKSQRLADWIEDLRMRRECRFAFRAGDSRKRATRFAVVAVQLQPPVMLGANAERRAKQTFRAGSDDAAMPFETAVEVVQQFLRLQRAQSAVSSAMLLRAATVAAADVELPLSAAQGANGSSSSSSGAGTSSSNSTRVTGMDAVLHTARRIGAIMNLSGKPQSLSIERARSSRSSDVRRLQPSSEYQLQSVGQLWNTIESAFGSGALQTVDEARRSHAFMVFSQGDVELGMAQLWRSGASIKRILGLVPQAVPPRVVLQRNYPCRLGVLINPGKMRAMSAVLSVLLGARHARVPAGNPPAMASDRVARTRASTPAVPAEQLPGVEAQMKLDVQRMKDLATGSAFATVYQSVLAGVDGLDTTEPEEEDPRLPEPAPVLLRGKSASIVPSLQRALRQPPVARSSALSVGREFARSSDRASGDASKELVYPYLLDFAQWAAGGISTYVMKSGIEGEEAQTQGTAVPASLLSSLLAGSNDTDTTYPASGDGSGSLSSSRPSDAGTLVLRQGVSPEQFHAMARTLATPKAEHRPAFERLVLDADSLVDTACLGVLSRIETALFAACNIRVHRLLSDIADVAQDMVPLVASIGLQRTGNSDENEQDQSASRSIGFLRTPPLWQFSRSEEEVDPNLRMSHHLPESMVVDPFDEGWLDGGFPSAALPRHGFLQDEQRDVAGSRALLRAGSSSIVAERNREPEARRSLHASTASAAVQVSGHDGIPRESMKARLVEARSALQLLVCDAEQEADLQSALLQLAGCAPSRAAAMTQQHAGSGSSSSIESTSESPLARYVQALPRWTDELGCLMSITQFDAPTGAEILVLSNAQLPSSGWILGPGLRWRERVALMWSKGERRIALRMVTDACARAERSWLAMRWRVHALTEGLLQPSDILDQQLRDPLQSSLYQQASSSAQGIGDFSDGESDEDEANSTADLINSQGRKLDIPGADDSNTGGHAAGLDSGDDASLEIATNKIISVSNRGLARIRGLRRVQVAMLARLSRGEEATALEFLAEAQYAAWFSSGSTAASQRTRGPDRDSTDGVEANDVWSASVQAVAEKLAEDAGIERRKIVAAVTAAVCIGPAVVGIATLHPESQAIRRLGSTREGSSRTFQLLSAASAAMGRSVIELVPEPSGIVNWILQKDPNLIAIRGGCAAIGGRAGTGLQTEMKTSLDESLLRIRDPPLRELLDRSRQYCLPALLCFDLGLGLGDAAAAWPEEQDKDPAVAMSRGGMPAYALSRPSLHAGDQADVPHAATLQCLDPRDLCPLICSAAVRSLRRPQGEHDSGSTLTPQLELEQHRNQYTWPRSVARNFLQYVCLHRSNGPLEGSDSGVTRRENPASESKLPSLLSMLIHEMAHNTQALAVVAKESRGASAGVRYLQRALAVAGGESFDGVSARRRPRSSGRNIVQLDVMEPRARGSLQRLWHVHLAASLGRACMYRVLSVAGKAAQSLQWMLCAHGKRPRAAYSACGPLLVDFDGLRGAVSRACSVSSSLLQGIMGGHSQVLDTLYSAVSSGVSSSASTLLKAGASAPDDDVDGIAPRSSAGGSIARADDSENDGSADNAGVPTARDAIGASCGQLLVSFCKQAVAEGWPNGTILCEMLTRSVLDAKSDAPRAAPAKQLAKRPHRLPSVVARGQGLSILMAFTADHLASRVSSQGGFAGASRDAARVAATVPTTTPVDVLPIDSSVAALLPVMRNTLCSAGSDAWQTSLQARLEMQQSSRTTQAVRQAIDEHAEKIAAEEREGRPARKERDKTSRRDLASVHVNSGRRNHRRQRVGSAASGSGGDTPVSGLEQADSNFEGIEDDGLGESLASFGEFDRKGSVALVNTRASRASRGRDS